MKKGLLAAGAAYFLWGFFPIYFKLIQHVSAFQTTAHRFAWSFFFLVLVISLQRTWQSLRAALTLRTVLIYLLAALLIGVNWGCYVWAVNNHLLLEASLGYFINPLVSVMLGVIFLRERLRPLQWLPVGLAAAGVLYLTLSYGRPPWVALILAFSFGLYGLVKKLSPLSPLHGLTLETGLLLLPALAFLIFENAQGRGSFWHTGALTSLLLVGTGIITPVTLLLFASGAQRVPLFALGLLQYIMPTMQFSLGVLVYHEPFDHARLISFSCIWLGLIIFYAETLFLRHKTREAHLPIG